MDDLIQVPACCLEYIWTISDLDVETALFSPFVTQKLEND